MNCIHSFCKHPAYEEDRQYKEGGEQLEKKTYVEPEEKEVRFSVRDCILRRVADFDAFPSGHCAEHNGRRETKCFTYNSQPLG